MTPEEKMKKVLSPLYLEVPEEVAESIINTALSILKESLKRQRETCAETMGFIAVTSYPRISECPGYFQILKAINNAPEPEVE